jgi:hypothetical protein
LIRQYSISELLSTFHGPNDPDGIETPALRPIATLSFHLQSALFDEHMTLQRGFVVILMGGLLGSVGLLLREVGLSFRHIVVVLLLFVSSRVFATLVLWISQGSLILAYTFMVLAALFYLRWIKRGAGHPFIFYAFAVLAVFTREEAYSLPVALVLLWWLSTPRKTEYQRPLMAALGILAIVVFHYTLRALFVPDAPQPTLWILNMWLPFQSAWMPGGAIQVGFIDRFSNLLWTWFLFFLAALFIRFGTKRRLELVFGICVLGLVLCTPALALSHPSSTTLPSLAFFTAIAISFHDVWDGFSSRRYGQGLWRPVILSACMIGLALGVTVGARRSIYVAKSRNDNAAGMVIDNGQLIFNMTATIPESRRGTFLMHLNALGVRSRQDWVWVRDLVGLARAGKSDPPTLQAPMFYEKYYYLTY